MKLLDKFYLTIYWCGNKGKGGGLIDEYLDKMFMFIIFGLSMIIISLILAFVKIDIKIIGIVIVSGILHFFPQNELLKCILLKNAKK